MVTLVICEKVSTEKNPQDEVRLTAHGFLDVVEDEVHELVIALQGTGD